MADYIDRNILCQAYVHIVPPTDYDDARLADLKKHLELFISTRGRFFLYEEVVTDVELKEGSLKMYLTIAGALYIAIGQYGSFRDGVNFLADDAKRLAECVVSESLFMTKSRHDNTIRVEARIGVVGSLKSALDRLNLIQEEMSDVSPQTTTRQINELKEDIETLLANLNDPADPPYVASEICKVAQELLPHRPPHDPQKPPHPEDMVVAYLRARSELIEILTKAAKRGRAKIEPE